jgi:signal transduction histidine kinase/tetratricopeptide (TPR) repeat protein
MKLCVFWVFLLSYANLCYAQIYNPEEVYQHLKQTNDYVLQYHILEQSLVLSSQNCQYAKKLKKIIHDEKDLDVASAIVLLLEAHECYEGNPQQQEQLREQALQIVRSSREPCFEAFIASRIAFEKFNSANFKSNIDYLEDTKSFIKQQNCYQYAYVVHEINYLILSKKGKNDLALKEILEAELLYKQHNPSKGFGWVLLQENIGFIFYQTKNYPTALKHWNQGLNTVEKFSIKTRTFIRLHNDIGLAHKNMKDYEQSLVHFSKAMQIAKEIKDSVWIGIPQGNIADVLLEQEKYEQAQSYLNNYLQYALKFKEHGIVVAAYIKLANLNYKQEKTQEALKLLGLGEVYLKEHEDEIYKINQVAFLEYKRKLYNTYVQVLEMSKNYSQAFIYQKKYQETVDSLHTILNRDKIAEVEGLYKLKERELENELLKQQTKNRDNEIVNQRIVTFVMSLIALVSLVGGVYMVTYFKLRKKYIKNLEYVNNFKSKIFSVISHDLRGYMSSLKGFVYLVRNQDLDKKDLDIITEELSKNTEYTSNLIDNLLLWAKSQLEGKKLKIENHPVKEIIAETIFEVSWFSDNKKVSIDMEVPDNLIVSADKNIFEIALRNLLTNAIKFTKTGGQVWVKAKQMGKFCEISVIDTGVGICPEDLEKIRSGISITNKGTQLEKGVGLGLILCRDSIQESGGSFYIESVLGKGTTVKFTLPLAEPSQTKNDSTQISSIKYLS